MKEENNRLRSYNDYCRNIGCIDLFPIDIKKSSNEKELKINDPFQKYQEYIKNNREGVEK